MPRWYDALIAGNHACVSWKCSGSGPPDALLPGNQMRSSVDDDRAGEGREDGEPLDRGGVAARDELQQDRRSGGDDDQQREPGDVIHRAMNTHTTTNTTAKTVKMDA